MSTNKGRRNKNKNKKGADETPVNNEQEQATFQTATEEQKTEEAVVETETTQPETVEEAKVEETAQTVSEPETSQKVEEVHQPETHEAESLQEKIQHEAADQGVTAEEQQISGNVTQEPEVAPVEHHEHHEHHQAQPEETHTVVIESNNTSHIVVEEPVKEHVPEEPVHVHEHKAPEEPVHVHVAPVSQPVVEQEEEKPVETEVKTNVEPEVGVAHHHEHVAPVEEKVPEVISDAKELEKVEEIVQHGTTEHTEHLHSAKAHEHNDTLTSSIQSNWENVEQNQVVVENPHVHTVVESEGKGIAAHAGSLQESWNIIGDKSGNVEAQEKALEQEVAAAPAIEHHAVITHHERLRRAEEHIKSAKVLEEQSKYGEAVNLLQSAKDLLNPDFFQGSEQAILEEVNRQILDCTLEIATCYDQLSDFNQSTKYARVILKTSPGNIQAIYLLGIGLIRRGEMEEARVVLKEGKESGSSEDNKYLALINKELEKLDQIAESRTKVHQASPFEEDLVVNRQGSVTEKKQEKAEETEKKDKKESAGGSSSTEYFLGSLVSSSVLSFVIAKYLLKFPTQRGIITSLVVGAVAGGVSLLAQRSSHKDDKSKKN